MKSSTNPGEKINNNESNDPDSLLSSYTGNSFQEFDPNNSRKRPSNYDDFDEPDADLSLYERSDLCKYYWLIV